MSEAGEYEGVEPVGFREQTKGPGEIAGLPRIDDDDWRSDCLEFGDEGLFDPASRFDDDDLRLLLLQECEHVNEAIGIVRKAMMFCGGPKADIEKLLRDIDPARDERGIGSYRTNRHEGSPSLVNASSRRGSSDCSGSTRKLSGRDQAHPRAWCPKGYRISRPLLLASPRSLRSLSCARKNDLGYNCQRGKKYFPGRD